MKLTDLPEGAQRLPQQAITSWMITGSFYALTLCTLPAMLLFIGAETGARVFWIGIGMAVLLAVFAIFVVMFIPRLRHRFTFFKVSEDDVMIQQGAIFVRRTVVPFARIQNIETIRGPLDRRLGLTNVKIFTAAQPISIECVGSDVGEKIREDMIAKVKQVRDELVS